MLLYFFFKHLQKFMDEAKHGVIFFSMGSNIRMKEMDSEKLAAFIKVRIKINNLKHNFKNCMNNFDYYTLRCKKKKKSSH